MAQIGNDRPRLGKSMAHLILLYNRVFRAKRLKSHSMNKYIHTFAVVLVGLSLTLFAGYLALAQAKAGTAELTVAAAADLSSALKEIADRYARKTGTKLKLSFGASGALTQQIQNDAPFDAFLSADSNYPKQLIQSGKAEPDLYLYAIGRLVLWVPADSPLDLQRQGMNALLDSSVKKIAIANPQHAPYGKAAMAALEHFKLYDKIKDRLVLGENVSQAAQFVESGNAQAGFVALAHALAPGMDKKGKYWIIPAESYPAMEQSAVVLSHSQHKKEATDFLKYIESPEIIELLTRYGFAQPVVAQSMSHGDH